MYTFKTIFMKTGGHSSLFPVAMPLLNCLKICSLQ